MQSVVRTAPANALQNPFLGSRMSYRVAAAPSPSSTAYRQVATMAKKKGVRIIVTLECTEARAEGGTPSRYVTQKVRWQGRQWANGRPSIPTPSLSLHRRVDAPFNELIQSHCNVQIVVRNGSR